MKCGVLCTACSALKRACAFIYFLAKEELCYGKFYSFERIEKKH